ncbi:hypothetical protein ACLGI4_28495 [Streptomyces sp. HMX112]|uniref:hypothetical protein n=1 Tax=Streptomyces sp. HMX112 TaxID=3390850 RepID=UPI003A811EC3
MREPSSWTNFSGNGCWTLLYHAVSRADARYLIRTALDAWHMPAFVDSATVVVSELVANAAAHAVGLGEDIGVVQVVHVGGRASGLGRGAEMGGRHGRDAQLPREADEFGGALVGPARVGGLGESVDQEQSGPAGGSLGAHPADNAGASGRMHRRGRPAAGPRLRPRHADRVRERRHGRGPGRLRRPEDSPSSDAVALQFSQDDRLALMGVVTGVSQQQGGGSGHGPPGEHGERAGHEPAE